jgi:hypothetical protein
MARELFIEKKFSARHKEIIRVANTILRRYAEAGYDLSLRQLYYQFVAHNAHLLNDDPKKQNSEQSYKMLGNIISDARDAGMIDWNSITDRGRRPHILRTWSDPADMLDWSAEQYRIDMWENQPYQVWVCVEKQALEGVLIPVCEEWGVPFSSNKGYSSASALYSIGRHSLRPALEAGKKVRVVYLGDHDPSGIDMTRDVRSRLALYSGFGYWEQSLGKVMMDRDDNSFEVVRIALNMDQVDEYQPPPNPAKLTDSRAVGYIAQYGEESWELDALDPATLANLVATSIQEVLDPAIWRDDVARADQDRNFLVANAEQWRNDNA